MRLPIHPTARDGDAMTHAARAAAAVTRDALAAAARLAGLHGVLTASEHESTPEPTQSVTEPLEAK